MKILLFSNDLMPFSQLPTSGGGLRCWQIYKGLQAHGYEVAVSMPSFTYLTEKHYDQIPEAQKKLLWNWGTQDDIARREKPDAIIFASNWDHYNLSNVPEVPLIIDLHGSRLIETTMWGNPVDTDRKLEILSKADCLLTAGQRQRFYFYGWLVQAGRVAEDEHFIRYIPISLSPDGPEHFDPEPTSDETPLLVSGGGWFPWQNQAKSIFAACRAVVERNKGRIEIYGTPHDTQTVSAEEQSIREIYKKVEGLAKESPRINVNGYVSRDDLLKVYSQASVAIEAMEYNLERELAFTTRTVEYLWCGLPVLYNNFGELSEHISEYDAGWCVDPTSEEEIAQALDEIFNNPELVAQKSRNAVRLVKDRFSWDKTILPLVEFLQNPTKQKPSTPAVGQICSRASYLTPNGTQVDVPLHVQAAAVEQSFIMPAENISTVEVGLALAAGEESRNSFSAVELTLRTKRGRTLRKMQVAAADVPVNGEICIPVPVLGRPSGGSELIVSVRVLGDAKGEGTAPVLLRALIEPVYPFTDHRTVSVRGVTLLGEEVPVGALALRFLPGTGRVYRAQLLAERGWMMIRQGEWRRLVRAVRNRIPQVLARIRHAM